MLAAHNFPSKMEIYWRSLKIFKGLSTVEMREQSGIWKQGDLDSKWEHAQK